MQYDEYRPKDSVITVGQLIKVMIGYKRKSLIRTLIITVSIFLVGFLAIFFGYNRMKGEYEANWSYIISTFADSKYMDGTPFYYPDLVTYENLKSIQEKNPGFASINIEEMVKNDGIYIKKNVVSETMIYKFTLVTKMSYYKNSNQAKAFVEAVVNCPVEICTELVERIDNTQFLKQYKTYAITYADLVEALQKQAKLIVDGYADLLSSYGNRYITSNDAVTYRLNDLIIRVKAHINSMNLDGLNEIVENNSYVHDYQQELPRLKTKQQTLNTNLEVTNNKIQVLQEEIDRQINLGASSVTMDELNKTLASLLVERENIKQSIKIVDDQINIGATQDTTEFDAVIDSYYDDLVDITEEFTYVQRDLHLSTQKIFYSTNSIIESKGGMGLLTSLGLPFVLGLLAAAIVNLCLDLKPYIENEKKKKETKETEE